MYKYIFSILSALLILQSCTTESNVHFNKDWSGRTSTEINIADYLDTKESNGEDDIEKNETAELFMMFNKETRPDSIQFFIDSISNELESKGIENFDFISNDNSTIGIEYYFNDITTLNENNLFAFIQHLGSDDLEENAKEIPYLDKNNNISFEVIGRKKLKIDFAGGKTFNDLIEGKILDSKNDPKEVELTEEEAEETFNLMVEMMGSMLTFKNKYTFERKIRSVQSDLPVHFKKNGKELVVNYSLDEFIKVLKEKNKVEVIVKLR